MSEPEIGWFCISTERDRSEILGTLDPEEQVVTSGIAAVSRLPSGEWAWRVGCIGVTEAELYGLGPLSGTELNREAARRAVMDLLRRYDEQKDGARGAASDPHR